CHPACYRRLMDAHELADVAARRAASGTPYLEFITIPDLSVGLYVLAAGQPDLQQPHTEDEVYYVIAGSGQISVGDEVRDVRAGRDRSGFRRRSSRRTCPDGPREPAAGDQRPAAMPAIPPNSRASSAPRPTSS